MRFLSTSAWPTPTRTPTSPSSASRRTVSKDAHAFAREYGVTFPIAIDDEANHYAVSNAYGLTNVPTLFYIAPSGEIEVSSVGWSKSDVEEVNAKARRHCSIRQPPALWRKGEDIREFRAG